MMDTLHYIPRKISEVNLKASSRICLIGKVVSAEKNSFVLEQDGKSIEIISEIAVEKDKSFRVFCSVVEDKLKADIIQSLNGFDFNLFKKVEELYNKIGV